jgi:hypothetical protein
MSGGHSSGGHGPPHHDAHGHGVPAGDADSADEGHDAHEPPAAPEPRLISPARDDYFRPYPGRAVLWPLLWFGIAALLLFAASRSAGRVVTEAHGDHATDPHR